MKQLGRRSILVLISVVMLTACSPGGTDSEGESMDLSATERAVEEASPRVVGFGVPSERIANGAGHALVIGPDLDSTVPPTAEELDVIVRAIWENVPWEPNAIRIAARDSASGDTAVDLLSAAEELEPMRVGPFGDGGAALTGMAARYGEWTTPE